MGDDNSNGVGGQIMKLWLEYEQNETQEARYVHELDKLEFALQAMEYEHKHGLCLDSFFTNTRELINDPQLLEILESIMRRRPSSHYNIII